MHLGIGIPTETQSLASGPITTPSVPFVTAIWGQSEDDRIINDFYDELTPEALVAQDRVTFWWHDRTTSGADGVQSITLSDATLASDDRVTAAMVAMGNNFMRNIPGRDIKIIMHTMGGTSPSEIMDDTENGDRAWQDDWALDAAATADGHKPSHCWQSWHAKPTNWNPHYGQIMFAFLTGRSLTNNNTLNYSETAPQNVRGIQVHRTLRDLYTHDPKWVAMPGAHTFVIEEDMQNSLQLEGGAVKKSLQRIEGNTESWRGIIGNSALASHFTEPHFQLGAYANGHVPGRYDDNNPEGTWADVAHPSTWLDEGLNYRARQTAHAICRAAGFTSWVIPEITNAAWDSAGAYMEFWSSAGAITNLRGGADPGDTHAHWTDVLGVEIDRAPAERAEIQSNGRVRVYPNSGTFNGDTVIEFGRGGASGWIKRTADGENGMWQNYPIVDVGLSDVPGIPLQPKPAASVLASPL